MADGYVSKLPTRQIALSPAPNSTTKYVDPLELALLNVAGLDL